MKLKTILLATAVSVALVGQAMPANAQDAETQYHPDDPFFGSGTIGFTANAVVDAKEAKDAAKKIRDEAQDIVDAASANGGTATSEQLEALQEAEKVFKTAKDTLNAARKEYESAIDASSKANRDKQAAAAAQVVNDLRGENGLVDQEIIVNGETVIREGRVTKNEKAITANTAAIAHNASRIDAIATEISDLQGGVAMAIAIANAPVISNGTNKFSLSGGLGYYDEAFALSMKGAFMPRDNIAFTGSVAYDFNNNYSFGAGVGFAF